MPFMRAKANEDWRIGVTLAKNPEAAYKLCAVMRLRQHDVHRRQEDADTVVGDSFSAA